MALGAGPWEVSRTVLRQALVLVGLGLVIGVGGALGMLRVLESFLYGVTPNDPLTYALATLVLLLVALAACSIPTRRAMRVNPVVALRYE